MSFQTVEPVLEAAEPSFKIPTRPQMPGPVVDRIAAHLADACCYLEYGSGSTTRMAARLRVPFVYSVESNPAYARSVRRAVQHDRKGTEVHVITIDIGEISTFGYPLDKSSCAQWSNYPNAIWRRLTQAGLTPDLVLIDGRFRVACFLTTLLQARPGTTVLFDDYAGREDRYGCVETYLQPDSLVERMAVFTVPDELPVRSIVLDLAKFYMDPR